MKDLDLYTTHTRDVVRPTMVVVPGGPVEHVEEKRGFVVRTRGDTSGAVMHTYRCPVHGEFDRMVPRDRVPDRVACSQMCTATVDHGSYQLTGQHICGEVSPWGGSRCGIGVSAGYVES